MTDFYTNVSQMGDSILYRGIENGKRVKYKVDFRPTLYVNSKSSSEWHSLYGVPVEAINPGTIYDCKEFFNRYKEVNGFDVYGMGNYILQYISDNFEGEIIHDFSKLKIYSIDIETTVNNGGIDVRNTPEEILLITIRDYQSKKFTTFGTLDYTPHRDDVSYVRCNSEHQLMKEFLAFWAHDYPDIVTGWNTEGFDLPYTVNRIKKELGEKMMKTLSPWNKVTVTEKEFQGKDETIVDILGVAHLDYLALYKKYGSYNAKESYALEYIAQEELGTGKLINPADSFKEFYENYPQTFTEYNIVDVELVDKLEEKLKLIELAATIAYYAKINLDDVYSPVKTWDAIIYNYLREQKIAIPKETAKPAESIVGAYVKDPIPGFYEWIVSFDFASLYPHLIMMFNISPETITDYKMPASVDDLLLSNFDNQIIKEHDLSMAANGWCYTKKKRGFLPILMERLYVGRSDDKKKMLKHEQELESDKNNLSLINEISRLNNLQMAKKILLNSGYGATANRYFRYYDTRMAEGITMSGQLAIQWVSNDVNRFLNKACKTEGVDYNVYNDTDSGYFSLKSIVDFYCKDKTIDETIEFMDKFCDSVIQPIINKSCTSLADYTNSYEQGLKMKREVLASKGIWIAKKRYILKVHNSEGVQYTKPKLKVMGLEMVRSSTPQIIRSKLKDTIEVILEGDLNKFRQYVNDYREEYNRFSVEEIAFPRGVNGMTKFAGTPIYNKGTPIHVRGALLFNYYIKKLGLNKTLSPIRDSDKIKFVYVKKPNPIHEDVIAFTKELPKEFGLHDYIDYDLQFEKTYLNAVDNIISTIGWTIVEQSTLEDFF